MASGPVFGRRKRSWAWQQSIGMALEGPSTSEGLIHMGPCWQSGPSGRPVDIESGELGLSQRKSSTMRLIDNSEWLVGKLFSFAVHVRKMYLLCMYMILYM